MNISITKVLEDFIKQETFLNENQDWIIDNIPKDIYPVLSFSILKAGIEISQENLLREFQMYLNYKKVAKNLKESFK